MEDVSHPEITAKHLNMLHSARKAFIETESNDKLCCTLQEINRATTGIEYEIGDKVYYKCKSLNIWKGSTLRYYNGVHSCSFPLISRQPRNIWEILKSRW